MNLGTRRVYLTDPHSGEKEVVRISIRLSFTHGEPWDDDPTNLTGYVDLVGDGWDMTLKVYAVDQIQAVGRLVKLAGAALLGSCERDGRELWTPDHTEALTDALQIF